MEINRFIYKVSRIFPSSLTSCQYRTLPDAIEPSINNLKTSQNRHENELCSSKKPPKNEFKNPKKTRFLGSHRNGRWFHPLTRVTGMYLKGKDKESSKNFITHSSSSNSGWFSDEKTEADVETNTFFSLSSTVSCESSRRLDNALLTDQSSRKTTKKICKTVQNSVKSASKGQNTSRKSRKNEHMRSKKIVPEFSIEVSDISTEIYYSNSRRVHPKTSKKMRKTDPSRKSTNSFRLVEDWTEESYAMEKCSKDPHSDFRASMLEMIVEKQIFGSNDLEKLLHCFLSLNEASYHGIIFDVFNEICETLFCN